jgi:hypothetical protein
VHLIKTVKNFRTLVAFIFVFAFHVSPIWAESLTDMFNGFLRHRYWVYELNQSTPINVDNQLGLEEREHQTMINTTFSHRYNNSKLYIDAEAIYNHTTKTDEALFNELYGSIMIPAIQTNVTAGRQKISFGTGIFVNPVEGYEDEKNAFDLEEERKGIDALCINFTWGNWGIKNIVHYDESYDEILMYHGKIALTLFNSDIGLTYSTKENGKGLTGFTASRYLNDNLELHIELAAQKGKELLTPERNEFGYIAFTDEDDYKVLPIGLMGLRYSIDEYHLTSIFEYFYNGAGLEHSEFHMVLNSLEATNTKQLKTPSDEILFQQAKLLLSNQYNQQHYFFMSIQKTFQLNTINFELNAVYSIEDKSGGISPQLSYLFEEQYQISIQMAWLFGDNDTEFGTKDFNGSTLLELKYLF